MREYIVKGVDEDLFGERTKEVGGTKNFNHKIDRESRIPISIPTQAAALNPTNTDAFGIRSRRQNSATVVSAKHRPHRGPRGSPHLPTIRGCPRNEVPLRETRGLRRRSHPGHFPGHTAHGGANSADIDAIVAAVEIEHQRKRPRRGDIG